MSLLGKMPSIKPVTPRGKVMRKAHKKARKAFDKLEKKLGKNNKKLIKKAIKQNKKHAQEHFEQKAVTTNPHEKIYHGTHGRGHIYTAEQLQERLSRLS